MKWLMFQCFDVYTCIYSVDGDNGVEDQEDDPFNNYFHFEDDDFEVSVASDRIYYQFASLQRQVWNNMCMCSLSDI